MTSPLNSVTEFDIVKHRKLNANEHALLLAWQNQYAVCRTQPERSMVIAENYNSPERGILSGALSLRGLQDVLSWVDRATADRRFEQLIRLFGLPALHLCEVVT